ncbi:MAG TPA: hypothetical protein VFD58_06985 [Blastocatellia bacterium]|nr:hypothetical protein [Blastocatellia bacterium]
MTSKERENSAALSGWARIVREVWLRERQEQLALQSAANAEVRKGWADCERRTQTHASMPIVEGRTAE